MRFLFPVEDPRMDFIRRAALAFGRNSEVAVMRDFLFPHPPTGRPRPPVPKRQMREKRTAHLLIIFGIVLAAVEIYVIWGSF